jgi:hypothetical protein
MSGLYSFITFFKHMSATDDEEEEAGRGGYN